MRDNVERVGGDFNVRPRVGPQVVHPRRVDVGTAVAGDDQQLAVNTEGHQRSEARLAGPGRT